MDTFNPGKSSTGRGALLGYSPRSIRNEPAVHCPGLFGLHDFVFGMACRVVPLGPYCFAKREWTEFKAGDSKPDTTFGMTLHRAAASSSRAAFSRRHSSGKAGAANTKPPPGENI